MNPDHNRLQGPFRETRSYFQLMTAYQRFEHIVALILSLVIAMVIVIALVQLIKRLLPLLLGSVLDPLDHEVFQALFGMIMTLLIALEFKHSIVQVALRNQSIIQVKTVILIALIALSRKFVILDSSAMSAGKIAALAFATLVLGLVYWLLRERDNRLRRFDKARQNSGKAETPSR
jgi:uncharacterized membrane protein (DUF373 family)